MWRQGRRGGLAKAGPCYVIVQQGHSVWVTRRGELWKCHISQIFPYAEFESQGLEVVPHELLQAKERLRFDSEKLGYVDVTQENRDDPDASAPDGHEGDQVSERLASLSEPELPQAEVPAESQQPRPGGAKTGQSDAERELPHPEVPAESRQPRPGGSLRQNLQAVPTHGQAHVINQPTIRSLRVSRSIPKQMFVDSGRLRT